MNKKKRALCCSNIMNEIAQVLEKFLIALSKLKSSLFQLFNPHIHRVIFPCTYGVFKLTFQTTGL